MSPWWVLLHAPGGYGGGYFRKRRKRHGRRQSHRSFQCVECLRLRGPTDEVLFLGWKVEVSTMSTCWATVRRKQASSENQLAKHWQRVTKS